MVVDSHNRQIDAYTPDRPPKEHEKFMCDLLARELGDFSGRFLDVGCATGNALGMLRERFPEAVLEGLELNADLIKSGKRALAGKDIAFYQGDAFDFAPSAQFDAILASGILGVFNDPYPVLERWLSWLTPGGKLVVFSAFNSNDVDVSIRFRNHYRDEGWETGFAWYSQRAVGNFLASLGYKSRFERFILPIDLEKSDNPIRQYTMQLANGDRILVNGANLIFEQYFMIAERE